MLYLKKERRWTLMKKILIKASSFALIIGIILCTIIFYILSKVDYRDNLDAKDTDIYMPVNNGKLLATKEKLSPEIIYNVLIQDKVIFLHKGANDTYLGILKKDKLNKILKYTNVKKVEENTFQVVLSSDIKNITDNEFKNIDKDLCSASCFIIPNTGNVITVISTQNSKMKFEESKKERSK